jgi:hypothetical protein
MDASQIAERHVVERYLANQLTEDEAQAFEAYVEAHPEVTREIELAARMKSGLFTLRSRGELTQLLTIRARRRFGPLALIAASVAAVAVAVVLLMRQSGTMAEHAMLAMNAQGRPISAHIALTRTRGEPTDSLPLPPSATVAELIVEPDAATAPKVYSVELFKVDGQLKPVAALPGVAASADGKLHLFVRAEALEAGNYLVRLAGNGDAPVEFLLRVTP